MTMMVMEVLERMCGGVGSAGSARRQGMLGRGSVRRAVLVARGGFVLVWLIAAPASAAAVPAPAGAAPGWRAPVDLSAADQDSFGVAINPEVAVGARGNAVAVWARSDGINYNAIVRGAVRPVGRAWQAPVDLSAGGLYVYATEVAVGARGDAVAVWTGFDGTNSVVRGAVRPVGRAWQAPVDLSIAGLYGYGSQVAVDARGNAVAVWARSVGTDFNSVVQGAVRPVGGAWQAPVDLSAAGRSAASPQVAVGARGDAVAVWTGFNGTSSVVQGAAYDAARPLLRSRVALPALGVAE